MSQFTTQLPAELMEYYNPINESIRVIPAGKHITSENLEEKPVEYVLKHGYEISEKGLIILREEMQ